MLPAEDDNTLNDILPRFWELNSLAISDSAEDENEVLWHFNKTVSFNEIEGRYKVQLLWKRDRITLPSKLGLCKKRLRLLVDRLAGNPEHLEKYDQIMRDQLREQFIEKVDNPRLVSPCYQKHDRATTKTRIVYDACARVSNDAPSLNDCLHPGPSLLQDLCGLSLKFREPQVDMIADI